ncbi:AAA family ATPase [Methylobacterium brachiatum]|uniref:AAA family ATPase n=1 Tax=Methylobacterium brachiatum TaxID=269660 RepID=UPI0013CEE4F5|nr:AAA family ATPase [Methylobacterium brachiatum]
MKIVQLQAENVKRLKAVEISPEGHIVEITGRNGQGKSSVLDAIWWALAGTTHIQAVPIRKGENEARIRLDLGEIKVVRTFRKREDETFTTSIAVESTDGARYPSPQRMLDGLLGALSFDPLQFTRMDGKAQLEALKRFVPGVDFEAIERANKADFDRRTDVNRQAKALRAQASGIVVPADAPAERIDDATLVAEMEQAGEQNALIERRRANREAAAAEVKRLDAEAERIRSDIAALTDRLRFAEGHAAEKREQLAKAGPLPGPIDTAALRERIADASRANAAIARREERARIEAQAAEVEAQSAALTKAMEERNAAKRDAIAKADLPVPGLGFGDDEILLEGVPFDQASSAEQLRTSVAIAMAANPKLRVIRVQDGSLLDEEAMRILAEMAQAADYQVWIERVGVSGGVAIVIEDGTVKGAIQVAQAAE